MFYTILLIASRYYAISMYMFSCQFCIKVFKYCSPTRSSMLSGRLPLHVNQNNECNAITSRSGITTYTDCQHGRILRRKSKRERQHTYTCNHTHAGTYTHARTYIDVNLHHQILLCIYSHTMTWMCRISLLFVSVYVVYVLVLIFRHWLFIFIRVLLMQQHLDTTA